MDKPPKEENSDMEIFLLFSLVGANSFLLRLTIIFGVLKYLGVCKNWSAFARFQGPFVQSVVNLMSSLRVKVLTVLVSTISNSQVFLLKKFSKTINTYAIFNDQRFNNMLTNGIISFEQLGPDVLS